VSPGIAPGAPGEYVVCEVVRRGRFVVAERFFEPGAPLTLGRRGSVPVEEGDLVVVRPERGRARVVEHIGSPKDVTSVLRGLLIESGAAWTPPGDVAAEVRRVALEPDGLDPGRIDLRDLVALTVDPPTARDFDDAFSIAREGDGLRLWVHIADVSFHVRSGGAIDRDASRRAFSVYMPGQVEPMLPHELSSGVCSLQEARDRRALTVEVLLDAQLRPAGDPQFYRSLIRSRARLTYHEAHEILEGRARHPAAGEPLALAARLADELRARRFARGALSIDPRELAFTIEGGTVAGVEWEAEPRAHALIEELMVYANELVAAFLVSRRRPAIYRVHELPDPESVEHLRDRLADLGVPTVTLPETFTPIDAAELVSRQAELLRAYLREGGRPGREAFTTLLLRALKQARYSPENLGHAGLASDAYCHFTSPIRRYPDLVVHRALTAAIGASDEPAPGAGLDEIAEHASLTERAGAVVERRAEDVCLAWLLRDQLGRTGWERELEGEVTGLIGAGLFVRFGGVFEGFLPSRRIAGGDHMDPNELATALVGRATGRRFRLGQELAVSVTEIEAARGRVTLDLAGAGEGRDEPRQERRRAPRDRLPPRAGRGRQGRRGSRP
jgi:ribonuclease R